MNLKQTLEQLYKRRTHGIKPGLDRMQALLGRMGNPEQEIAPVHVAGTNGKGSVCAMVDSILRAASYRSGIYTSPHLVRLNERIRVGGECISDDDLAGMIRVIDSHADEVADEYGEVTFFEFTTAMAFEYFRQCGARLVVLETGMGGRLDATNVVEPVLSVITRIGIDHTAYLGHTIEDIAAEKAGIIKQGRPVVMGDMPEAAAEVIIRKSAEMSAPLSCAGDSVGIKVLSRDIDGQKIKVSSSQCEYPPLVLPLLGEHQVENAALAVAAAEALSATAGLSVPIEAVVEGLSNVCWPARLQVLSKDPLVILDGAHNESGAGQLKKALARLAGDRPIALVMGMLSDKDVRGFVMEIAGLAQKVWAVAVDNERGLAAEDFAGIASSLGLDAEPAPLSVALEKSRKWAADAHGIVCICGSLYLAGEVLALRERDDHEKRS